MSAPRLFVSDEEGGPFCAACGTEVEWMRCTQCDEGYSHHDCGEDTCCCVDPEDNVPCRVCEGEGGWLRCPTCYPPHAHEVDDL